MTADKEPATMLRLTTAGDGSRRCHTRHPSQVLQRCCAASITQSARSTLASFVLTGLTQRQLAARLRPATMLQLTTVLTLQPEVSKSPKAECLLGNDRVTMTAKQPLRIASDGVLQRC